MGNTVINITRIERVEKPYREVCLHKFQDKGRYVKNYVMEYKVLSKDTDM